MKGNWTLAGKHIAKYTDVELKSCTTENYIMLLTNVTPINE